MDVIQKVCLCIFILFWIIFCVIKVIYEEPPINPKHNIFTFTRGGLIVAAAALFIFIADVIWRL